MALFAAKGPKKAIFWSLPARDQGYLRHVRWLSVSAGAAGNEQLEILTAINTREFIESLGLGWASWGRGALARMCRAAARRISADMARFDAIIAQQGLHRGSRTILTEVVAGMEVDGAEQLPTVGPLLIAANHPGLCDVLMIFATLQRDDLKVVAADYPLLRALDGFNRYFIFVSPEPRLRRKSLNCMIGHLERGGALLILPAGAIEPDPAISPDALAALEHWSPSLGLLVRRVPDLALVTAVVSGVLLPEYQNHPLTRVRHRPGDRQQLGSTLQVLARASRSATVRLTYGPPTERRDLIARGDSARCITSEIVQRAHVLMRRHVKMYAPSTPTTNDVPHTVPVADNPCVAERSQRQRNRDPRRWPGTAQERAGG
jgi:hypothetical protein